MRGLVDVFEIALALCLLVPFHFSGVGYNTLHEPAALIPELLLRRSNLPTQKFDFVFFGAFPDSKHASQAP